MNEHDGGLSGIYHEHPLAGRTFDASEPLGAPAPFDRSTPVHSVIEGPLVDVAFFVVLCVGALFSAYALFVEVARRLATDETLLTEAELDALPPLWVLAFPALAAVLCVIGLVAFPAWSRLRTDPNSTSAFSLRLFAWVCASLGLGALLLLGLLLIGAFAVRPLIEVGRLDIGQALFALAGLGPVLFAAYCLYALPGYLRSLAAPADDENTLAVAETT